MSTIIERDSAVVPLLPCRFCGLNMWFGGGQSKRHPKQNGGLLSDTLLHICNYSGGIKHFFTFRSIQIDLNLCAGCDFTQDFYVKLTPEF